ncbi:MAG: DUF3842 family protein [Treponema sp.]|jgi:hypothetical protein|nr:DUF3842 family protein [Treponema sp.]
MAMKVVVIDGMGGGIGAQLIGKIRETLDPGIEVIALGTNAAATERMMKAGAQKGATGENAIKVSVSLGDFVLGPVGIVIGNSMLGEITPDTAAAVLAAPGVHILLPLQQEHFHLVGLEPLPLAKIVERAVGLLGELMEKR